MRLLICTAAGLILWATCPLPALAASSAAANKKMCKKIHDALRAGQGVDQIIAELGTDAETVVKCTQKRGKRKAGSPPKKAAKTGSKASNTASPSSTEKAKTSAPSAGRPSAPHPAPWPAHLP